MALEERYEFLEKIGDGAFASVYRARDDELGREVAIKKIHAEYLQDPQRLQEYWTEAQLLASLQHPNIVTIFDLDRPAGWVILELMQANLQDRLAGRQMDLRSLRAALAHVLRALKYLHARGVVHGDIKPSNLMIDARRRVKLGDFGLARRVSNADGSLIKGTTKYMPPEAVSEEYGTFGAASDLYSLGFSAYELMCGGQFDELFPGLSAFGRNKQVAWMMWHAAPDRRLPQISQILEGVPDDLATVIQRLCAKDLSERYSSAAEALDDLNVDTKAVPLANSSSSDETPEEPESRRRLVLAASAFVLSTVLSMAVLFWPDNQPETPPAPPRGVIRDVLLDEHSIVLVDSQGRAEKIELGPRPSIFLAESQRPLMLDELQPDDFVEIRRVRDGGTSIVRVEVIRPVEDDGRIIGMDHGRRTVLLRLGERNKRSELTVQLTDSTAVSINGVDATIDDLIEGDAVSVEHRDSIDDDDAGRRALRLAVKRSLQRIGWLRERGEDGRLLVDVDPNHRRAAVEFVLAKDCSIRQSDEPRELPASDLRPGDRLAMQVDTEVTEIVVHRGQPVSGAIDGSSTEKEIVVRSSDGRLHRFDVGKETVVTVGIPNNDGFLGTASAAPGDLREYDSVCVTFDSDDRRPVCIDVERQRRTDRSALLIGIGRYSDGLSPLPRAVPDVRLVRESLMKFYALNPRNVETVIDADRDRLNDRVEDFLGKVGPSAQLVVYIHAHGYQFKHSERGLMTFLAGSDFQWDDPINTGIDLSELLNRFAGVRARECLVFVDASHAGSGTDLDAQPGSAKLIQDSLPDDLPDSVTFVASCDGPEQGLALGSGPNGIFATAIGRAFSGAADLDRDLIVTPDEAMQFLDPQMRDLASAAGRKQTPIRLP